MTVVVDKTKALTPVDTIVTDGVDTADVLNLTNADGLAVAILDGTGSQITSFGTTQYVEGATSATATGNVVLWKDTGNALTSVSSSKPLPISGAVTGPLTDTQLRATAVPVSGTVTATGPLTDTQLRATAVPISGTVTASGPLTDTQLRATAVPVSGTVTINAIPTGSNVIGKVAIDQTTPGTTNLVQVGGSLPAGTALIGKFGIDQTTPGTTNGVQVAAALPTGANVIGKVSIDQTTPGTTNLVQVGGSLPAGTNAIGKLSANSSVNIGTVDVATLPALAAGTNVIGKIRGTSGSFDVTFVLDTAAYASGDVLVVPQAVSGVVSANGGTALLHSIVLNDKDDQGQALDLVFMRSNVSLGTINSAVSISDANADEIFGVVSINAADWIDLGGCRIATKTAIGLVWKAAAGSTDLYIGAISRGTGTYTASGITAHFCFASID